MFPRTTIGNVSGSCEAASAQSWPAGHTRRPRCGHIRSPVNEEFLYPLCHMLKTLCAATTRGSNAECATRVRREAPSRWTCRTQPRTHQIPSRTNCPEPRTSPALLCPTTAPRHHAAWAAAARRRACTAAGGPPSTGTSAVRKSTCEHPHNAPQLTHDAAAIPTPIVVLYDAVYLRCTNC